jgi:hypothetical protein
MVTFIDMKWIKSTPKPVESCSASSKDSYTSKFCQFLVIFDGNFIKNSWKVSATPKSKMATVKNKMATQIQDGGTHALWFKVKNKADSSLCGIITGKPSWLGTVLEFFWTLWRKNLIKFDIISKQFYKMAYKIQIQDGGVHVLWLTSEEQGWFYTVLLLKESQIVYRLR